MSNYEVQLMKRASRRLLGDNPNRKSPITINMLIRIYRLLDLSWPFHAAVWPLLLVAFFSLGNQTCYQLRRVYSLRFDAVPLRIQCQIQ